VFHTVTGFSPGRTGRGRELLPGDARGAARGGTQHALPRAQNGSSRACRPRRAEAPGEPVRCAVASRCAEVRYPITGCLPATTELGWAPGPCPRCALGRGCRAVAARRSRPGMLALVGAVARRPGGQGEGAVGGDDLSLALLLAHRRA